MWKQIFSPLSGHRYAVAVRGEVREGTVRMVCKHQGEFECPSSALTSIAPKIGFASDPLRVWVRGAETDSGQRDAVTSAEHDVIKALAGAKREVELNPLMEPVWGTQAVSYDNALARR